MGADEPAKHLHPSLESSWSSAGNLTYHMPLPFLPVFSESPVTLGLGRRTGFLPWRPVFVEKENTTLVCAREPNREERKKIKIKKINQATEDGRGEGFKETPTNTATYALLLRCTYARTCYCSKL